jgi:hypothetical protein
MKKHKAVKYLISRRHVIRIQLFAINSRRHTEEMIVPFCHQMLKRGEEKLENFQESRLMIAESGTQSRRRR